MRKDTIINIKENIKKDRQSNIELLRIVLMLMIITHHYCVNAGFDKLIDLNNITTNTIIIQFMAIGGKVGVNAFILISGYFMVNSKFNKTKVIKLICEIVFYNIIIMVFLIFLGYKYEINTIVKDLGSLIFDYPETFIGSYLLVYILSPVINKMIKAINESEYLLILGVLIFYFSILGTFFNRGTWNYFGWAVTMYLIGSYIKIYNKKIFSNKIIWIMVTVLCITLIWVSEILVDFVGVKYNFTNWEYMITNSNKILVFIMAISLFLVFKNINVRSNKIINVLGASSFGVLLIHANSNTMRQWLWKDLLNNTDYFNSSILWVHMFISVIFVYIVCATIDICRIKFIEKPIFDCLSKNRLH